MTVEADSSMRDLARARVLTRLGVERLVTHGFLDIVEAHRAHALSLAEPKTFDVGGLTIEAPAGIYHPHPDSSSLLFIRNIEALAPKRVEKGWDLGCGSGAIGLYLARRFGARALATDISTEALAATRANARRNGLEIQTQVADMFEGVETRDFDLVVFNVPLIDAMPESDLDRDTMCDPGGDLLADFAEGVEDYLAPGGLALTAICCNSAYERLEAVRADMRIVGIEMAGNGFWRAILGLRHARRRS